ncbi:hypothetical protein ACFX10_009172 [Malus domestica]
MTLAMPKMASSIADMVTQCRAVVMPLMPNFVPRGPLGAKSGSLLEKLAIMKSDKVDSIVEVVPKPTPLTAETDSPARNEEIAYLGSYEKSTEPAFGEAAEICALLKLDLFEDMCVCAKFVDGVKGVVCLSSFAKHMTEYRKTTLLAMM